MTATEQSGPYYHGTDASFEPGVDQVEPGHPPNFGLSSPLDVSFTPDPAHAATYGSHVYLVEPTGPVCGDGNDMTTRYPMRVIREAELSAWAR